ncbi:MAG: 1-phosphofructokinase family hexose kinase [Candidatus Omnitrophica bacterium]|nr:1-phosphofructokinase family hexose kinase [Candidatus Omnitrophota bacterium]
MIATITLNPSIDQLIQVKNLVKDDANRALSVTRYPGGKGINVSKVIRELGGQTHAYAPVGGMTGEFLKELLGELDIPFTAMPIKGKTRINTILTDLKDRTQTRVSDPGPLVEPAEMSGFSRLLLSARPRPFLWALGGSLPSRMPASTYHKIILVLQKQGVPCILDTDNDALKWGVKARPFAVKPNEYEMERLMGRRFKSIPQYLKAARELVRRGIRVVIVSLGARGALFVTRAEAFHVRGPDVPVKSKVGAGDSLIGGFALGLFKKMPLHEAARLGIAASVSAVMRESPRLCLKSDISRLLPRVRIRDIMNF